MKPLTCVLEKVATLFYNFICAGMHTILIKGSNKYGTYLKHFFSQGSL